MKTLNQKNTKTVPIIYNDLFDSVMSYINQTKNGTSIIVPHVCNNSNAFGAGFAGAVAKHYPIVKENYHMLGSSFLKNNLGYVQFIETFKNSTTNHKLIFANMIAQNGTISQSNPRPLNYYALVKSMLYVDQYIKKYFNDQDLPIQIHAPKFGSGLAGGNWSFINDLIEDIWSKQTVLIYDIRKPR